MSVNLSEEVRSAASPELVRALSAFLGENEEGVSTAIEASISTVLKTISEQSALDLDKVPALILELQNSGIPDNIPALFHGNASLLSKGAALTGVLLGNRSGVVSSLISSHSVIKPSSASTVLNCIVPLVLGKIGRHTSGMSNQQLDLWIQSSEEIKKLILPEGITVQMLGAADLPNQMGDLPTTGSNDVMPAWVLLVLLLALAAMLLLYFK